MKQLFFLITGFFISLFLNAQALKADVSIKSITISPRPSKNIRSGSISSPNNNTNLTTGNNLTLDSSLLRSITNTNETANESSWLDCSIIVQNGNDEASQGTTLIIVLPYLTQAAPISPNGTIYSISARTTNPGYIQYDLGRLNPGQSITVEISFLKSAFAPNNISAYVFSRSSDPNPLNNYKAAGY